MIRFLEQLIVATWNRLMRRRRGAWNERGETNLGFKVVDEQVTRYRVPISNVRRTMHLAILGKTGSGKSSLLRHLAAQDVEADRGFVYFDIHGDATPFLLGTINARERREHRHLDERLVLIEPADPIMSVGLNPLEQESPDFVRIAEVGEVLRWRWGLDHFGARTDELLRNALYVLAANGLTLVELRHLLTNGSFRSTSLQRVDNAEVREYFRSRYDQASEAMRATMREPILNKTSAFTADPHFRHIVGQAQSTFSIRAALDEGQWVIVNLQKGRLGSQALTLGSLIFTAFKNGIFTRERRSLFTLYCDEMQNLLSYGGGIETMLSEARKFGCSIVGAHQFLDQLPAELRSALFSVGTHVLFQLSTPDAMQMTQALDGGKTLTERLKNLPQRHAIVKSGADRGIEIAVPTVHEPKVDYTDLFNRARYTRGRVRAHIERDIAKRTESFVETPKEQAHEKEW
jgi:hypothetical protein